MMDMTVVPVLGKLRQEEYKVNTSPGYTVPEQYKSLTKKRQKLN